MLEVWKLFARMNMHSMINGVFGFISFFYSANIQSGFPTAPDVSVARGKDGQVREGLCVKPLRRLRAGDLKA